jgi:mono/diheme cytochrome c family protein
MKGSIEQDMKMRPHTGGSLKAAPVALVLLMASCTNNSQSPGLEYMPDMYRGPAIEAYVDFGQEPYHYGEDVAAAQRERPSARVPAEGTIPFSNDPGRAQFNMPYPYPNSEEGYTAAGRELRSPFAMTEATVAQGKILYDRFCDHCHGATGAGDGTVVERGGHPPPGAFNGPLSDRPEGQIFHVITYGRGVMGPHASLVNKEERWLLTHYVRTLQNEANAPGAQAQGQGAEAGQQQGAAAGNGQQQGAAAGNANQ